MKTCQNPNCKTTGIPDEAKFCPKCGEPFETNINSERKRSRKTQSSSNSSGGKVFLIILVIIAAIIGIVVHNNKAREKAEIEAQNHYLSSLDSNAPSGFHEGQEDWNYPLVNENCTHIVYYGYEWHYDEQCYVTFTLEKCFYNENLYGFAIYYGPNIRQTSYHKASIKGIVDDNNTWKFATYDKHGKLIDKYEGYWLDKKTFYGVCTNKRGRKIQFKGIDYID